MIAALYNGMVFFSATVFGRLGDTLSRRKVVMAGFFISGIIFLLHNFVPDLKTLFIVRGLAGIGVGMIPGSLAALAWSGSVALFTSFGSLGFAFASIIAGLLKQNFFVFTGAAFFCLVGFIFASRIKEKPVRLKVPFFPLATVKKNIGIYLPYLIRHSAASAIWAIFPIYLLGLGANRLAIGVIYGLNPVMQFIFMLMLDRYKKERLIDIGLIATSLTFLGYFLSPNWQIILIFQIVLGFSWANLYLGSMKCLLERNDEQATATGLLNSVLGLSGIIGPLIGGIVVLLGTKVLFIFSTLLSLSALFVCRKCLTITDARSQVRPAG
ncbi:hypothetical protein A2Y85_00135 [candidate division WOR-3 bacterium RBG_13_43_14]|uniref:Major facilitator superfamily (MFS) profile domain-containing protein n=1 Tax=candidate division WOR-3 bacterium RBG_13_43_14 TaxID=1802590 RepID=A0A1F4UGX9_UNCW3|nr:MAG: hypothetical protein A2Y85_00135 [candidate division WOR-3 bacterium RBG_13_43_14]